MGAPERRLVQTSNATAARSTMPLTSRTRSLGAPIRDIPLLITAMIRPPVIAPTTLPTPPCTAAPPMNAAAMASSSKEVPAVGPAWLRRAAEHRAGGQQRVTDDQGGEQHQHPRQVAEPGQLHHDGHQHHGGRRDLEDEDGERGADPAAPQPGAAGAPLRQRDG